MSHVMYCIRCGQAIDDCECDIWWNRMHGAPVMPLSTLDRDAFVKFVRAQENMPYIWGGKGMYLEEGGRLVLQIIAPAVYDCSGLVTSGIHAANGPDWRATHTAQRLWNEMPLLSIHEQGGSLKQQEGDLLFYGRDSNHVTHVMAWIDGKPFGACGGGSFTRTLGDATRSLARVKSRSNINYRPDFLGWRSLT